MSEWLYFDCHAGYGPRLQKAPQARWTRDHLIEDLDLAGIAGALVTHSQSLLYDPMLSNLRLVKEIAPHRDRLYPCWVALPPVSGEFPPPEDLAARMHEHDVRAVRIEPSVFDIPVNEHVWGSLRDMLRREQLFVITSTPQDTAGFSALDRLLEIFREIPMLLVNLPWHRWRRAVDLMDRYPQLHLEFSAFQANRAVEYFAERFGAHRCLFGTGLPDKAPGAARGFLDWTLLDATDAQLIAGGNLRRLLGGRGPSLIPSPGSWHDELTQAVRAGHPLPCLVIDAHCHVLHDGGQTGGRAYVMLRGDAEGMIELKDRIGIDQTAIMSWSGPLCCDTPSGNQVVEQAVRRYPDRFIGLSTINPGNDTADDIDAIIAHYHGSLGFPGLKTYGPAVGLRYDDPALARWFRYGHEHHLYAVIDDGGRMDETELPNLARRFPDLGIHLDHCGRSWTYAEWAVGLMGEFSNVWAQINYTSVPHGVIEYLVREVGSGRVLFGTDAPMRDPRPQAAWVTYARIGYEDKQNILGANFGRILDTVQLTRRPLARPPR